MPPPPPLPVPNAAHENPDADWGEPWLSTEAKAARRVALGLEEPEVTAFTAKTEFISLGSFCGVARALQSVGLKTHTYPFDWTRTPVEGVIHCLESNFEDFLTFTVPPEDGAQFKVFKNARWGGSFWHHNPETPKVHDDFVRRIERLLGFGSVPASAPRVFVWAPNATREIDLSHRLLETLRRALPEAERVRLIILTDLQSVEGPHVVDEIGDDILFFRIHQGVFSEMGKHWSMERCAENYGKAVAQAVRIWAGRPGAANDLKVMPDIDSFAELIEHMDGGHTGSEGYWPRRFQGQRLMLPARRPQPPRPFTHMTQCSGSEGPPKGSPPTAPGRLPGLLPPMADIVVPGGITPGTILETEAFGRRIRLQVPDGVCAGQLLRLRFMEGVVTFASVAAAMTTTTAAAAVATASLACTASGASPSAVPASMISGSNYSTPATGVVAGGLNSGLQSPKALPAWPFDVKPPQRIAEDSLNWTHFSGNSSNGRMNMNVSGGIRTVVQR